MFNLLFPGLFPIHLSQAQAQSGNLLSGKIHLVAQLIISAQSNKDRDNSVYPSHIGLLLEQVSGQIYRLSQRNDVADGVITQIETRVPTEPLLLHSLIWLAHQVSSWLH